MQINQHARLSIAPMMDWTDRHCRFLHRLMSRQTRLYTEMVTSPALVRGGARHLLRFDRSEHPVALQLGGSDPVELTEAASMGADEGYDEINLNVGCPSDRVQSGTFGAVLMKSPALVAECVEAMMGAVSVPVTVKCRIGVDDQEPREVLPDFLRHMREAGITEVAIHARKAWLQGLSPKENREVPPLDYDLVVEMKEAFPDLTIWINGGVNSLAEAKALLARGLDGVMIGRAAYHSPWDVLGEADPLLHGTPAPFKTPQAVVEAMLPYIEAHLAEGGRLHAVTRHMLGMFTGRPGARRWRRVLSEGAHREGAGTDLVLEALEALAPQIDPASTM
ncbi:MAG: tRNA dihydrouridine(20/20a) synthase DusA [Silicimonas sp.]|nr:tRNA dihydrouridine(20/20a) synthase DusA [Silicimonas sp.]